MYKINYKTIDDLDLIRSKGFLSVPMLEIDNQTLNYKEALTLYSEELLMTIEEKNSFYRQL